jgi:hypothetical protein
VTEPMDARAMDEPAMQIVRPRSTRWRRLLHGHIPVGVVIVCAAALIDTLRDTAKFVALGQFKEWSVEFAYGFGVDVFVGCTILLAVIATVRYAPARGARKYLAAFVAVAIASAVAVLAYRVMEDWPDNPLTQRNSFIYLVFPPWLRYTALGMLVAGSWLYGRAESEHAIALKDVALDSARMDEQTAEARLQMLEAQIEPHFLFNTLAHVKWLYDTDRVTGARMLLNLKDYLAIALPQMRETESTLGREIAHVTSYLNIQQIRMGRRLAFSTDVPKELEGARMPPLMLLTLTENAIKHGLGPLSEGGRIDVHVTSHAGLLRATIADTGSGITKSKGAGTGLANIRARLRAQFGGAARLALTANAPQGVVATIELPLSSDSLCRPT